jgi:hypothetical protein
MHNPSVLAIFLLAISANSAYGGGLPKAASVIDSDLVGDFRTPDSFALSPDRTQIAYISKGALWVSGVAAGPSTKVVELPNTTTAFMATPEFREARRLFNRVGETTNNFTFKDRPADNLTKVFGLKWTRNGIYYVLANGTRARPWTVSYQILEVANDGKVEELTTVVRNGYDDINGFTAFEVTDDKSMVVMSDGYRPLICKAATGKPKATCFDWLVASQASGRFIGIEIDTRELVVTDSNLEIEKRTGVTLPGHKHCELIWSPDERFVICRIHNQFGLSTNTCHAYRLNLETLDKRDLEGDSLRERLAFIGNGGELIRTGVNEVVIGRYVDGRDGTHVLLVPDGNGPTKDIHTFAHRFKLADRIGLEKPYPPVTFNQDCSLFAMALPRKGDTASFRYWLISRDGETWPFVPDDPASYNSPYHVLAFAGEYIIACDDIRLFSVPISSLKSAP